MSSTPWIWPGSSRTSCSAGNGREALPADRGSDPTPLLPEDGYHEFTSDTCEEGETVPLRCLTLRADYAYGDYPRGHRWFIPQSEIHREIRRMSRSDTEFMWRVRRCEVNRYDVEKIILGASHGVIRLHMV